MATPVRVRPWARIPWPLVAGAAVVAVALQLWGLYRVGTPTTPWFPHADKVQHTAGFAAPVLLVLFTVYLRAQAAAQSHLRRTTTVVAAAFAGHAGLSELIQHTFYRSRSGDLRDLLADGVGIALGVGGFMLLTRDAPGATGR